MRTYTIQTSRSQILPIFTVPRVDYDALLDSLTFPLIWAYDEMLEAFLPAEVDHAFLRWLESHQDPSPSRVAQLYRYGLLPPPARRTVAEIKAQQDILGFTIIQSLLPAAYSRGFLTDYYFRNEHLHERFPDLPGIKRTSANNLPLMRLIHMATEKLVNSLVTEEVKSSYSFTSAYEMGSSLPAHTDRPQCVYNISLMLSGKPSHVPLANWPIQIKRNERVHSVRLMEGDAVLYSGTRDLHWRDEMPPELQRVLGVFFHYVPIGFEGTLD